LRALRESELVDYEAVRRVKLEALEAIFKKTKPKVQVTGSYPVFEALREKFGGGWQSWSKQYQDPRSPAVKAFAEKNANRVGFHAWLQQIARGQLEEVQRHTQDLGMPLGLYVDLALGADRGGAEVWADQDAFAVHASCGAPPDEFNPRGQDWGLPPYSPRALRAKAYRPFIDLLRANMPVGGALRMDHVMAPVVDSARREAGARRLCELPVPRAARGAGGGKPPRALPGGRGRPRHGPGRIAHRAQ
jgi:4-alpha-glucanotransferase